MKMTLRLLVTIAACATPPAARTDEPQTQASTKTFVGRYAKGEKVIRIEAFGDQLLALPLWWGGVQPLDRRSGATFEMQNKREAVFTFTAGTLTIRGHGELDGAYRTLGSELAPLELLRAGKNAPAYRGFRKLGLDDQAILQLVQGCVEELPSRREEFYSFVKYLIDQGLQIPGVYRLAAFAAVAIGDRAGAKAWCEQILKEKPDDAAALSTMRKMGNIPTSGGWQLPFALADAYRPPTPAELERVRAMWKSRDLKPRDIRKELEAPLKVSGLALKATVISYLIHGQRNFGAILVPPGAKKHSHPVLVDMHGVSSDYEPLIVPGESSPAVLAKDRQRFVVFLPAYRGERLVFDGKTYQCEGNPDDSWDGATDDVISFISAALEYCPQADAKRIVALGKSRGGTVAMLLGERDPRVRAIVSWSGPVGWIENMPQLGWSEFEVVREGMCRKLPPEYMGGQAIRTFFKRAIEGKANLVQTRNRLIASSPIYFLSQLPPAQLHYGVNDYDVPVEEGRSIEAALARLGSNSRNVTLIYEEDGGHDLNPKVSVPMTRQFLFHYAGLN